MIHFSAEFGEGASSVCKLWSVTDCAADATDKADSDPFVDGFGKERACSDGNEGRSWTK